MKSFEIIHTITSPYRIHMFNIMHEILTSKGINFHVHFMSDITSHRPDDWSASLQSINFNHSFWPDKGIKLFGNKWHFNPGIINHFKKNQADVVLIGGPWASLTTLISSFTIKSTTNKIAWIEGNIDTINSRQLRTLYIKKMVLNRFDYCAVPGKRAVQYINRISNNSYPKDKILSLPNTIDENLFRSKEKFNKEEIKQVARKTNINLSPSIKTAILPARLIPEKGLLEFFSYIDASSLNGWQIIIAGKGPLKNDIMGLLHKRNLDKEVKIIDPVNYKEMPILYSISDLFIIPSVKDNNPLTVIEALHSNLPVLASTKIGNHPEAIQEEVNGWSLNPYDSKSILKSSNSAFNATHEQLQFMGCKSKDIAKKNWDSRKSIEKFLAETIKI